MALTLGMITIDSTDPGPLAKWWADLTGGTIEQETDGWFYMVGIPGWNQKLGFQRWRPHPRQEPPAHGLGSGDLDAEVERVLAAGATEVHRENMDGFRWVTFADPQGNQFCVSGAH
ncbi:VOC family protein [Rhodococcus hoagii]|nr:VOC family protein [Prescottella equi]